MKTSLKRNTKTYSARSIYNDRSGYDAHNVYDTFCLFPPLVLNPSILLIVLLNQSHRCESSQSEALALIMKCKSVKSDIKEYD